MATLHPYDSARPTAPGMELGRKIRVLCLHGKATNATILKYQINQITKHLDSACEFVFLQGPLSCQLDSTCKQFFQTEEFGRQWYLDPYVDGGETLRQAHLILNEHVQQHNVDILLGFSQGAALASGYVLECSRRKTRTPIKGLILLCGSCPLSLEKPGSRIDEQDGNSLLLPLPVAFVSGGRRDPFHTLVSRLERLCLPVSLSLHNNKQSLLHR